MKKIFYFTAFAILALLPCGCYEDKGNYDYSDIGEVTVDVKSGVYEYNVMMGEHLTIPMAVTSDIPESDLEYMWEGVTYNGKFFDLTEGRDFDSPVGPDDYFASYAEYTLRLRVSWKVNGRPANSYSPLITVSISGETGLMVLHGNDTESDIGVIQEPEFLMKEGVQINPKLTLNNFSTVNGFKLPGKGKILIQQHAAGADVDACHVYIITDQTAIYAGAEGFAKKGDYFDLFYTMGGVPPQGKGKPQRFGFYAAKTVLIDDGEMFMLIASSSTAKFDVPQEFIGLPGCKVSPLSYLAPNAYLFDVEKKRFFKCYIDTTPWYPQLYDSPHGAFNINDMKADLLHFDFLDTSGRYLGVFRGDDNEIFIGEINFAASGTAASPYAYAKYGILNLPGFETAKLHAFGNNGSMCYYATDTAAPGNAVKGVFQYAVLGESGTTQAKKLMLNSSEIEMSGEVTMMKVLKSRPFDSTYQHSGVMLLVGTYENGVGTLHAILLSEMTGQAVSHKTFTGFGRISDANLKTM